MQNRENTEDDETEPKENYFIGLLIGFLCPNENKL